VHDWPTGQQEASKHHSEVIPAMLFVSLVYCICRLRDTACLTIPHVYLSQIKFILKDHSTDITTLHKISDFFFKYKSYKNLQQICKN
jgi:hypothetical protein